MLKTCHDNRVHVEPMTPLSLRDNTYLPESVLIAGLTRQVRKQVKEAEVRVPEKDLNKVF